MDVMDNLVSNFGIWDLMFIASVAITGTTASYIKRARLKAFVLILPTPLTFGILAVGQPVNVTHATGLIAVLAYTFAVKAIHKELRVSIIPSIIISAFGYCLLGAILASTIPKTDNAFLAAAVGVCILASILHYAMPLSSEPGARSPLAVWKKFIAIVMIVVFITIMKQFLQGFMATFPILGVIVAYEARLSLYTVCRHIPVTMLVITPFMTTCYILQDQIGLIPALVVAWCVYLIVTPFFILPMWKKYALVDDRGSLEKKEY